MPEENVGTLGAIPRVEVLSSYLSFKLFALILQESIFVFRIACLTCRQAVLAQFLDSVWALAPSFASPLLFFLVS